ncbi:MAG: diguanylate cyclase [Desulfobulbus sp.]|jgi:GGDEF domain-containing protein|nr:diguanylate cyclase [Desulfobulbus sp.]
MEDVFALLDTVNSVSPTYFLNLVNWLLALARRHNEERFTIIGLRLQNMVELNARLGQQPVLDMMDTLATRLRELVRSTDLSTRTGQQMFWLLLPKTGQAQHRIVLDRILALRNLLPDGGGIDFETVVFSAPEDMQSDETGKLLLARLEGELA